MSSPEENRPDEGELLPQLDLVVEGFLPHEIDQGAERWNIGPGAPIMGPDGKERIPLVVGCREDDSVAVLPLGALLSMHGYDRGVILAVHKKVAEYRVGMNKWPMYQDVLTVAYHIHTELQTTRYPRKDLW